MRMFRQPQSPRPPVPLAAAAPGGIKRVAAAAGVALAVRHPGGRPRLSPATSARQAAGDGLQLRLPAVGGAVFSPLEISIRVAAASEGLVSPAVGAAISELVAFVTVPDNTRRVYTDPALRAVVVRVLGVTGGNVRQAERILRSAGAFVGRTTIERIRDVGAAPAPARGRKPTSHEFYLAVKARLMIRVIRVARVTAEQRVALRRAKLARDPFDDHRDVSEPPSVVREPISDRYLNEAATSAALTLVPLVEAGRIEDALRLYNTVLLNDASCAAALVGRAVCYDVLGDSSSAMRDVRAAEVVDMSMGQRYLELRARAPAAPPVAPFPVLEQVARPGLGVPLTL